MDADSFDGAPRSVVFALFTNAGMLLIASSCTANASVRMLSVFASCYLHRRTLV